MLKDLRELIDSTKQKIEENDWYCDFSVPSEEFCNRFIAEYTVYNDHRQVRFNKDSIIIDSNHSLKVITPFNWLFIGAALSDLYSELINYQEKAVALFDYLSSQNQIQGIKKKDWFEAITNKKLTLPDYSSLFDFVESNADYSKLSNFIINPTSWDGGKTADRGDFYYSVLLKTAQLVQATSGYVADYASFFSTHSQLKNELNSIPKPTVSAISAQSFPLNRIIYGAPGTGKSHQLEEEAQGKVIVRVVFSPEYTYGHFVGSYKPVMKNNVTDGEYIAYDLVAGPFLNALVKAKQSPEHVILLIEEINRANVYSVFGDIFQLLDRKDNGESKYSIRFNNDIMSYLVDKGIINEINEMIGLPSNLSIWATMNSADQGVFPLDTAFKRRWSFEYLSINHNSELIDLKEIFFNPNQKTNWNTFRTKLNDFLYTNFNLSEDKLIGPFFLSDHDLTNGGFSTKLLLYLWEDVLRHRKRELLFSSKSFFDIINMLKSEANIELTSIFSEDFMSDGDLVLSPVNNPESTDSSQSSNDD